MKPQIEESTTLDDFAAALGEDWNLRNLDSNKEHFGSRFRCTCCGKFICKHRFRKN